MEESKELQGFYKIFRTVVYVSVLLEFFEYAIDPCNSLLSSISQSVISPCFLRYQ